jgi:hypothetical protein
MAVSKALVVVRVTSSLALLCPIACSDDEDDGIPCTTEEVPSVLVTALDSSGALVTDAELSYSVGGAPQPCENLLGGLYGCGSELRGDFAIQAVRGEESGSTRVEVTAGECHVITQEILIRLQSS